MDIQNIKVAVDAVVFGYKQEKLFVLLVKQRFGHYADRWVLPGGFVQNNESLIKAVNRELLEETNVQTDYLEQLYTFGDDVARDPRGQVISVAYLALVNPGKLSPKPDTDAKDVQWFDINKVPFLPFDHNQIIQVGLQRLVSKVNYKPIGFDLLDEEFIFSDLESLYKTILNRDLDRRNFRKKILGFGILKETGKIRKPKSGRPAQVYRFDKVKYQRLEKSGFHFEIKFA